MDKKTKKALKITEKIISWVLLIGGAFMMIFTIISITSINRNDRNLFGYRAYIVLSDSMKATDFEAGDLIFVKYVEPSTLKPGDIVSYISTNTYNFGEIVTHKIRTDTIDDKGNPGFITYGTTTNQNDDNAVTYEYILGKYQSRLPKAGHLINFLKKPQGYITCILLPFGALFVIQGVNTFKAYKAYKGEKVAKERLAKEEEIKALENERKALIEERLKTEKLREELLQMKQQMEDNAEKNK